MSTDNVIPFPSRIAFMAARERAGLKWTRARRAAVLSALRGGESTLETVLARSADPLYGKFRVSTLLNHMPGIGKFRRNSILRALDIDSKRRISGLGARQREELLRLTRRWRSTARTRRCGAGHRDVSASRPTPGACWHPLPPRPWPCA